MNKEIQIFNNNELGQVRGILINGEPYFVGKDVAEILGYTNPQKAIRTHVDDEDKGLNEMDTPGGIQQLTVINESGLYSLILSSKLPNAKKFKRWVTSEVLPQIRKTGRYEPVQMSKELQAIFMIDGKTEELKNEISCVKDDVKDLKDFNDNMPLLLIDCDEVTKKVKSVATRLLGYETPAYNDRSVSRKVYSDIYAQLKREFGVRSYKAIKRSQLEKAVEIIDNYVLPLVLSDEILFLNNQMKIGI